MLTQGDGPPAAAPARACRETGSRRGCYAASAVILACALLVVGCATHPAAPVPLPPKPIPEISAGQPAAATATPRTAPAASIPAGARAFEIDSGKSSVTILVNKAGPFAKFAHDHVVTSGQETGVAWVGSDPAGSGFEIRVPVAALIVDDPAARSAIGGEFAGEVPDSARQGTYANMTRPEVLDAAEFPEIAVRCDGLQGTWDQPVAPVDLTIRGATRRIEVPIALERSTDRLVARGAFRIRQTDFGITPFSAAGGAIQVGDELEIRFEVVAVAR